MKQSGLRASVLIGLACLLSGCNTSHVIAWNNSGRSLNLTVETRSSRLWTGVIASGGVACFKFKPQEDGAFRVHAMNPDGTKIGPADVDYYTPHEEAKHLIEITSEGQVLTRVYDDYRSKLTCTN